MLKKIILSCLSLVFIANISFANDKESAKNFVNNIADQVITLIEDKALSNSDKEVKLENLFKSSVDIEWIGNFALGRYAKTINPDQKMRYNEAFSHMLINNYVPNFKKYTRETFHVTDVIGSNKGEFLVKTEIIRPNTKNNLQVNYAVKADKNGQLKIIEIVAEGVSLITTQRNEFGSILSSHDIDFLIDEINNKLNKVSE